MPRTSITTRLYARAIALWGAKFDTAKIADELDIPEHMVARWVANYRDLMHGTEAA